MFTIAVINQKGGVGKTTIATNLAAVAHLGNRRTLVLDLDPQGTCFDWHHARKPDSPLAGLTTQHLDRPPDRDRLAQLGNDFDVAIVDTPPRLDNTLRGAAIAADVVVIPVRPQYFDAWAVADMLETLIAADALRERMGLKPVPRFFLLNQVALGTNVADQFPTALKKVPKHLLPAPPIAPVQIRLRPSAYTEAGGQGEALASIAPRSQAAAEMRSLFRFLTRAKA